MSDDIDTAQWRKSSHSGGQGGDCVEVAALPSSIAVRDSKHPNRPALAFSRTAFTELTRKLRARP
ncbi:DUF397 domain-containing protein [Actinocorallia libanotica]|uniref:DUF397 domain-containing protein n=1 Tax=Actinocorallia libanotica TaxID=46162 RepID=A0ABN1Q878_9ACTN